MVKIVSILFKITLKYTLKIPKYLRGGGKKKKSFLQAYVAFEYFVKVRRKYYFVVSVV